MRLICIANSRRPDGRCIAGIAVDTGEFIRPIAPPTDAIPEHRVWIGGRLIAVGDIIELELRNLKETARFQCENRLVGNWNWKRVGKVPTKELLQYCDDISPILHSPTDRVLPIILGKLPPENWRSLQLVRPRQATFERDSRDQHRWRVRFKDKAKIEYFLRITDPIATLKLESGQSMGKELLLLVSLAKPWAPPDASKISMCYKIVATIIEI